MEYAMNKTIIQVVIKIQLIQTINGRIMKIIKQKVKFLMEVRDTNAKQDVKCATAQLILQNAQLVWMDLL